MKKTFSLLALSLVTFLAYASESVENALLKTDAVKTISKENIENGFQKGLWNKDKNAYAISFKSQNASLCYILLKRNNGFKIINVSPAESGNFGKLGHPRTYYEKYETIPTKWYKSNNEHYQIEFTTIAWKNNQKFTTKEPLILKKDGTPIHR